MRSEHRIYLTAKGKATVDETKADSLLCAQGAEVPKRFEAEVLKLNQEIVKAETLKKRIEPPTAEH